MASVLIKGVMVFGTPEEIKRLIDMETTKVITSPTTWVDSASVRSRCSHEHVSKGGTTGYRMCFDCSKRVKNALPEETKAPTPEGDEE